MSDVTFDGGYSSCHMCRADMERTAVERERKAFVEGWQLAARKNTAEGIRTACTFKMAHVESARRYPMPKEGDHGACMCSWEGERITWFNESCPVHAALRKEGV